MSTFHVNSTDIIDECKDSFGLKMLLEYEAAAKLAFICNKS